MRIHIQLDWKIGYNKDSLNGHQRIPAPSVIGKYQESYTFNLTLLRMCRAYYLNALFGRGRREEKGGR